MVTAILVLLIPAAYYVGKYTQWRAEVRRHMSMRRGSMQRRDW